MLFFSIESEKKQIIKPLSGHGGVGEGIPYFPNIVRFSSLFVRYF